MSIVIKGWQVNELDRRLGAFPVSGSHGVRERGWKEVIVCGEEPELRHSVGFSEHGGRIYQALSPSADMLMVVTASATGEADHAHNACGGRIRKGDGAEASGRLSHDDDPV